MLGRYELEFNDDVVKLFENEFLERAYPDFHFMSDKVSDEGVGWVYESDRAEEMFEVFINTLYMLQDERLLLKYAPDIVYNGK